MRITDAHIEHWRRHGYVVVERFLTSEELQGALEEALQLMPSFEEREAAPRRYRSVEDTQMRVVLEAFPFPGWVLNQISAHPQLISFAERALGTTEIALSSSQVVGKYAGAGDYEQSLHCDFANNTVVYPKDDERIADIATILYYTDVTDELSPTYVVSQEHTRGRLLWPNIWSRQQWPELYEHELPVTAPAGSILIYTQRTVHRGSAMIASRGMRIAHHIGLRAGAYRWLGQTAYQNPFRGVGKPELDSFLVQASPRQRELVGFPPPGSEYWDEETLTGVAARYPGMDMTPYRGAAKRGPAQ